MLSLISGKIKLAYTRKGPSHGQGCVRQRCCRPDIFLSIYEGDTVMKNILTTVGISTLVLFLIAPAYAHESHTAEAMEHAGMAQAHGEDGHAKVLLQHAEESLKHAQAAEKQYADQHMRMTESVKHLKEAIEHAKMGHADVATKHVQQALTEMSKAAN
jgi:Small metal-binding protein